MSSSVLLRALIVTVSVAVDRAEVGSPSCAAEQECEPGLPVLLPVAEGLWEHVPPRSSGQHNETVKYLQDRFGHSEELLQEAKALHDRWLAGDAGALCVPSSRAAFAALTAGGLLAFAPTECTPELEAAVRALGGVRVVVIPSQLYSSWRFLAGWQAAFPDALVVVPSFPGLDDALSGAGVGAALVLSKGIVPGVLQREILKGFGFEVMNGEIALLHELSRTLLTADLALRGSSDAAGRLDGQAFSSEECSRLHGAAFFSADVAVAGLGAVHDAVWQQVMARRIRELAPPSSPLPVPTHWLLTLALSPEALAGLSASLEKLLSWRPARVLSARVGKVFSGGEEEAAALLEASWGWCADPRVKNPPDWVPMPIFQAADSERFLMLLMEASLWRRRIGSAERSQITERLPGYYEDEYMLPSTNVPACQSMELLVHTLVAHAPGPGLLLEFGVADGFSANATARLVNGTVHGFDSFEGLPDDWTGTAWKRGTFAQPGGAPPPVMANVRLHKGLFNETLPGFLAEHPEEPVAFANLDCDLYSSTLEVLRLLRPRLRRGSLLHFHDFELPSLTTSQQVSALRDFMAEDPLPLQLEMLNLRDGWVGTVWRVASAS